VPTIARGTNDDQIGDIVKFAGKNLDVVKGVNFQPISFAGRVEKEELRQMRITIPETLKLLSEQTNCQISPNDFYPVSSVLPFSHFIEAWKKKPQIEFTIHPHCGAATYVFTEGSKFIPITRFVDVEKLLNFVETSAQKLKESTFPKIDKTKIISQMVKILPRLIDKEKAPKSIDITKMLINIFKNGTKDALGEFHRKTLFIGTMHFQDAYNFDLERVKRCGIHYVVPDGRIIPFCSYNTIHRENIEKKFSRDL